MVIAFFVMVTFKDPGYIKGQKKFPFLVKISILLIFVRYFLKISTQFYFAQIVKQSELLVQDIAIPAGNVWRDLITIALG